MDKSGRDEAQYRLLKDEEAEDHDHREITPQQPSYESYFHASRSDRTSIIASLGMISLFSVALNFVLLFWHPLKAFPTDFPDAKQAVEYEQRVYTGGLVFDPETVTVERKKDYDVEYFGPQANEAWDKLFRGRYVEMTRKEAKSYVSEPGAHQFEPSMFHSLDCLNDIRLRMSTILDGDDAAHVDEGPEHSDPHGLSLIANAYTEYCLDHIMQVIMCQGDLSPSMRHNIDVLNVSVPVPAAHTCRKWRPIREWLDTRGAKGG